jgi:hypothetical protein
MGIGFRRNAAKAVDPLLLDKLQVVVFPSRLMFAK